MIDCPECKKNDYVNEYITTTNEGFKCSRCLIIFSEPTNYEIAGCGGKIKGVQFITKYKKEKWSVPRLWIN